MAFIGLILYSIFAIVYYYDQSDVVLQALSMLLLVVFLFFATNFVFKYIDNKELMSK